MPGKGEIEPYHRDVASDVAAVIGQRVMFHPAPEVEWYKVRDGAEVAFDLVAVDLAKSEPAMRMRREDSKTHRVSVFSLCSHSSSCVGTFWVSWHETWVKQNARNFVLLNAGWTLFEGLPGIQNKDQILRADWDQLEHRRSKQAGHPHWHFDHDVFIRAEPDKVEAAPGLVELSTKEAFAMGEGTSIGYVHLAMGAWSKDVDHPACWQRSYEDDCRQLRDWCVKTLRYLKEQVGGS